MTNVKADDQMMLIDLPVDAASSQLPKPTTVAGKSSAKRPKQAPACIDGRSIEQSSTRSESHLKIVRVDPRMITIDPVNVRHGMAFDPEAQVELITSMRIIGNTVPVRLRPNPDGGYWCPSGSQRLGAALHILHDQSGFELNAIITKTMDDREAFALGEADNAGHTAVAPMLQARKWAHALKYLYGGNRQAFIAATGRSPSLVSRTLALAALPNFILSCCSDVEALTPHFSEQLAPKLADPGEKANVQRRAKALAVTGKKLPGPQLIRALVTDPDTANSGGVAVWQSPDGWRQVHFRAGKKGGRVDLTNFAGASADERRDVVKAFDTLLEQLSAPGQVA